MEGMVKTVLITGGMGFIGQNIINCIKDSYNLIIIGRKEIKKISDFKYYKCDISNLEELEKVFKSENIDSVIHLATYYKPIHTKEDISSMIDTNVKGLNNILELCLIYGIKSIINTGSCFEYGNKKTIWKETDKLDPWGLYAETKILAEDLVNFYCKKGLNVISFRLFPPFGPYEKPTKIIPYVITNAIKNNKIELTYGEQKWDYTYSKDIAESYKLALETSIKGHEIINISNNKPISLKEIVIKIIELTNSKSKIIFGAIPYRDKEIMYLHGDNSKAKRILNWVPIYDFETALKETIEYFKENNKNENC